MRDRRTKAPAAASVTLEEFLASLPDYRPGRLDRRAIVHGHCHQKALVGMEPTRQVLSKVEGLEFTIPDSGCCGMAGSFGYEQGHYEVSQACGERVLFPAVRGTAADDLVVAPASAAATRSPTSATTAAHCTRPSCWRWRGENRPTSESIITHTNRTMADLNWRDAIQKVLEGTTEAMHYSEIAEAISERGYRKSLGATPASTVNAMISTSIQNEGEKSPFIRASRGYYALRELKGSLPAAAQISPDSPADSTGLIHAFGMFWNRHSILWTTTPKLLGQQQTGSIPVDFYGQNGVYLLYDGRSVVYVGRTTDQPLGLRLKQHTTDRLNGRWDRFSWFGVYPVGDTGKLNTSGRASYDLNILIATMEALLIEGLEPPQNRKRGDDFKAIEFLQVEDPQIQKLPILQLMDELKKHL